MSHSETYQSLNLDEQRKKFESLKEMCQPLEYCYGCKWSLVENMREGEYSRVIQEQVSLSEGRRNNIPYFARIGGQECE